MKYQLEHNDEGKIIRIRGSRDDGLAFMIDKENIWIITPSTPKGYKLLAMKSRDYGSYSLVTVDPE